MNTNHLPDAGIWGVRNAAAFPLPLTVLCPRYTVFSCNVPRLLRSPLAGVLAYAYCAGPSSPGASGRVLSIVANVAVAVGGGLRKQGLEPEKTVEAPETRPRDRNLGEREARRVTEIDVD